MFFKTKFGFLRALFWISILQNQGNAGYYRNYTDEIREYF